MSLITKLQAIGDAIRDKTGDTNTMTLDEMVEAITSMKGALEKDLLKYYARGVTGEITVTSASTSLTITHDFNENPKTNQYSFDTDDYFFILWSSPSSRTSSSKIIGFMSLMKNGIYSRVVSNGIMIDSTSTGGSYFPVRNANTIVCTGGTSFVVGDTYTYLYFSNTALKS